MSPCLSWYLVRRRWGSLGVQCYVNHSCWRWAVLVFCQLPRLCGLSWLVLQSSGPALRVLVAALLLVFDSYTLICKQLLPVLSTQMWHWITALREKDGLEMPDSYWIRTLTECPGVRNSIHVSASVWCPALSFAVGSPSCLCVQCSSSLPALVPFR